MTSEMIAIIGVGIALAAFNWRVMVRMENRLDSRIDRLDSRIDRLDGRIDRLDERMERLGERVEQLGERVDRLNERMDRLDERIDKLDGRIDRLDLSLMPWGRKFTTSRESFPSFGGEIRGSRA